MTLTLEELEARISILEDRSCVCGTCIAARKARVDSARILHHVQLATEPATTLMDVLRAMPESQRRCFWKDIDRRRVVEIMSSLGAEDFARFLPETPGELHDSIRIERVAIPAHVKLVSRHKKDLWVRYRIPLEPEQYSRIKDRLHGITIQRENGIGYLPTMEFKSLVIRQSTLDALCEVDEQLAAAVAPGGELEVTPLSADENKAIVLQSWRLTPVASREQLPLRSAP